MNNLKWFNQDDVSDKLLKNFPEKVPATYFCDFILKSKTLEKIIPVKADDYVAPWTEPGLCLKWYGLFEGVYFQLTARLGNSEIADVQLFLPASQLIDWRIFKHGNILPSLLKRLTWINGNKDASISLFCIDEDNLSYEFYRAKSENDAEELKEYLVENNFRQKLFIGKAENPDSVWIVEKEGEVVARYSSRYTCEWYAVRRSKQDNSSYFVKCESDSNFIQTIFRNGKLVN